MVPVLLLAILAGEVGPRDAFRANRAASKVAVTYISESGSAPISVVDEMRALTVRNIAFTEDRADPYQPVGLRRQDRAAHLLLQ